jgi:acyl-coenzyme A thioesterase PaaI-like protein
VKPVPPENKPTKAEQSWRNPKPGQILGRGHMAGDFLEAYDWKILEQRPGYFKLDAHLPDQVKNPRGQLFGGYTPTYVDLVALRTVHAARPPGSAHIWLTTLNMRVDYLEPIVQERFLIEGEVIHHRRGTHLVEVRFRDHDGNMLAFAVVTIRERS